MVMEAHANFATADIVEVIKVNFLEDLDSENVGKEDHVRDVNIKKVDEKQVIRKIEGQFRNLQVCSISFKHDQVALKVVESWKDEKKFDDQAFINSSKVGLKIWSNFLCFETMKTFTALREMLYLELPRIIFTF